MWYIRDMVATMCTSLAVMRKAGENVDSTGSSSGALIEQFINAAEGQAVAKTKLNLLTNYSLLSTSGAKYILEDYTSSAAAVSLIDYNMGSYNSQAEAQTMLDVNKDIVNGYNKLFEDTDYTKFIFAGA